MYSIPSNLNLFQSMKCQKIIKSKSAAYKIFKYESLESTNTFLKKEIENFRDFSVVWAEEQTAGRGRFTRKWDSIAGKDLTFSVLLPLVKIQRSNWPNITQIAALAIAELLEEYSMSALVKWPNDVLVNRNKICGILCETVEQNKQFFAILGVGLNVNSAQETLLKIGLPATSMYNELNHTVPLDKLIVKVMDKIIQFYNELSQSGFSVFRDKIKQKLAYLNEEKTVVDGEKRYTGQILDINPDGTLLFKCNDNTEISLHSGELSFGLL